MSKLVMPEEGVAPDTPSANQWVLYFKAGGLYIKNGAGNEVGPFTGAVLTAPQINDTSADHQYIFAVSELVADRNITLPLLTGDDTFVFAAHAQTLTNKVLTLPQINDTSSDHQYVFAVSELTADRTVTLPLLTGNDEFVFAAHAQTLTNKRITKRIVTTTQAAAPAINTDNGDVFHITGLAQAITSLTANLTGTPTDKQQMWMEITDDGTGRAIAPGASFVETANNTLSGLTTVANKTLILLWVYSSALSKWRLMGKDQDL